MMEKNRESGGWYYHQNDGFTDHVYLFLGLPNREDPGCSFCCRYLKRRGESEGHLWLRSTHGDCRPVDSVIRTIFDEFSFPVAVEEEGVIGVSRDGLYRYENPAFVEKFDTKPAEGN